MTITSFSMLELSALDSHVLQTSPLSIPVLHLISIGSNKTPYRQFTASDDERRNSVQDSTRLCLKFINTTTHSKEAKSRSHFIHYFTLCLINTQLSLETRQLHLIFLSSLFLLENQKKKKFFSSHFERQSQNFHFSFSSVFHRESTS